MSEFEIFMFGAAFGFILSRLDTIWDESIARRDIKCRIAGLLK